MFEKVATVCLARAEAGVCPRQHETQVTLFLSSQGCSSELRVSLKRVASRHMSTWELCACHSSRQVFSEARTLKQIKLWHELGRMDMETFNVMRSDILAIARIKLECVNGDIYSVLCITFNSFVGYIVIYLGFFNFFILKPPPLPICTSKTNLHSKKGK